MQWTKHRVTTVVWEANGFKITEQPRDDLPDIPGALRYRLESPYAPDEHYATLEAAKGIAKLQNKLAVTEEDNRRLRELLELRNGVWPADHDADLHQEDDGRENDEPYLHDDEEPPQDDGRGIPGTLATVNHA